MTTNPAEMVVDTVQHLVLTHSQLGPTAWLYAEKSGGFQCGSCRYAIRGETDGKGTCQVMSGPIDLNTGCCLAWTADPGQLRAVEDET
jgi:hypothetical protein